MERHMNYVYDFRVAQIAILYLPSISSSEKLTSILNVWAQEHHFSKHRFQDLLYGEFGKSWRV